MGKAKIIILIFCLLAVIVPIAFNPNIFGAFSFLKFIIRDIAVAGLIVLLPAYCFRKISAPFLAVFAFIILSAISLSLSVNKQEGFILLTEYMLMAGLFVASSEFLWDEKDIKKVLFFSVIGAVIVSVYSIVEHAGMKLDIWKSVRLVSTLGNKNYLSEYLVAILPVSVYLLLKSSSVGKKILYFSFSALIGTVIFLCQSRAGYLAVLFSALFYLVLRTREKDYTDEKKSPYFPLWKRGMKGGFIGDKNNLIRSIMLRLTIIAVASIIAVSIVFLISSRFSNYGTGGFRIECWKSTVSMIKDKPLFGVGPGNFKIRYPEYRSARERELSGGNSLVEHPHNQFLEIASEQGIVGLGVFIFFIVVVFTYALRSNTAGDMKILTASGIVGIVVCSFFGFSVFNPVSGMFFWLFAGIMIFTQVKTCGYRTPIGVLSEFAIHYRTPIGVNVLPQWERDSGSKDPRQLCWRVLPKFKSVGLIIFRFAVFVCVVSIFAKLYCFGEQFSVAKAFFDYGKHKSADGYFKKAYSLHPDSAMNLDLFSKNRLKAGFKEDAVMLSITNVKNNPSDFGCLASAGYFNAETGRLNDALYYLNRAKRIKPENADVYYQIGRIYFKKREYKNAIINFTKAVSLEPGNPFYHNDLGFARVKTGDTDNGMADYAEAIRLNPNFKLAYQNIASVYFSSQNYSEAGEYYVTAYKKDNSDREMLYYAGISFYNGRDFGQAKLYLEEYLRYNTGNEHAQEVLRTIPR